MDKSQPTSFVAAAKDFFGLLDGQTNMTFMKEIQKLTPEDRKEITQGLEAQGYKFITA